MKTLFIPAKINFDIDFKKIQSLKLPKKLAIAYSIQYKDIAEKIKKILSEKHTITSFIQVLGCSNPKFPKNTDAVLLISSGKFHAISLALNSEIPIYLFENNNLEKISEQEVENLKKKKKSAYLKFLNSEKIGILISTKPGQENLQRAMNISKKLKDKKNYFFLSNEINVNEFENFDINSWVNTACPRMDFDASVINISDLEKLTN
jgi:diphthamide biosynthesis enzyme Dph1/Dph2-like protein